MTFLAVIATAALAAVGTNAVWKAAPNLFGWETHRWSEWPEVIPPNGWLILILSNLIVLVLAVVVYRFARHWSTRASFSLLGLFIFLLLAVVLARTDPRGAITFTWPVLIGSAVWITAAALSKNGKKWLVDASVFLAAIPTVIYILPLVPAIFMGDGTKSVAITAGAWVIILGIILPVVDGLLVRQAFQSKKGFGV